MDQQTKRYGISLAVTVLCHVGAALWLGMAGFLFLKPPVSQEPIEIVLNTGGGQAGGGQKALPSPVEETAEMDHPSLSTQEEEPTAENVTEDFPIMEKQEDPVVEEVFHRTTLPDTNASSLPSGTEMPASLSGAGSESGSGEGDATGQGADEGEGDATGQGADEGEGSGQGDGEGSGSQSGVPVTPPSVVSYVEPDYPGRAMLDGTSGVVQVRITVNASGEVDAVSVSGSSGSAALDRAAVEAVYRWTFSPALDTHGQPMVCTIYLPVNFKIR